MAVAAAAVAAIEAPNVIAQPKFKWRMLTTWPPALDVWQGSALRLGKVVEEMSGGRLQIEVSSAGQIMPPLDIFDAASRGSIESFMSATVLAEEGPGAGVVHRHPVRHEPAGHVGLVLPGR